MDGVSSPEKNDTQDQPFWLSGSYSRARYISQCQGYNIFPSQVKLHPKKQRNNQLFRTLL